MALSAAVQRRRSPSGPRRRGKISLIVAAVVCLSTAAGLTPALLVACDDEGATPPPPPPEEEQQTAAADAMLQGLSLLDENGDSSSKSQDSSENGGSAQPRTRVRTAFVTSMTRQEFTVLDPDSVVAGAGTEEMLPEAVLGVAGAGRDGLRVLRRIAGLSESAKNEFIRTVPIREPAGTILDFDVAGYGSRCPAKNYGVRARVTELQVDGDYLRVFYQQYDPSGHLYVDEEGVVTVMAENIIRTSGDAVLEKGSLIALLCRDYNDHVLLHVGWPNSAPVYRMDDEWKLPVKIVRLATTVSPSRDRTVVIAMLQVVGPPTPLVLDPATQEPIDGVFLYVGRAKSWSRAYDALAHEMEGKECTLVATLGELRPSLHCSMSEGNVSASELKLAGKLRRAKIATSITAATLAAIGGLLFLSKQRKTSAVPLLLMLGAIGGAIGTKERQDNIAKRLLQKLRPVDPRDEEHIVFIKADSYGPPTEEENQQRKVKMILDYAREKEMELEEEERVNKLRLRRDRLE